MNKYAHIDKLITLLCDSLPHNTDEVSTWLGYASSIQRALPADYDSHCRARLAQSVGAVRSFWRDVMGLTWRQRQMQTGRTFGY